MTELLSLPVKRKKGKGKAKANLLPTIDESSDSEEFVVSKVPRLQKPPATLLKPTTDDVVVDGRLEVMVGKCIAVQPNAEPLITRDTKTKKLFASKFLV